MLQIGQRVLWSNDDFTAIYEVLKQDTFSGNQRFICKAIHCIGRDATLNKELLFNNSYLYAGSKLTILSNQDKFECQS
jgi:hypothetical protein